MQTPDAVYFLDLQTRTGWGRTLARFADWINPLPGWRALDVGCGPGLFPALLAAQGCSAVGVDLDPAMLSDPLHPLLGAADALHLPFADRHFDLVTASNLLFLLPDPVPALREMVRVLAPTGMLALLNPSEHMSTAAAQALADDHQLTGLARDTLLNWAGRAERHFRWSPQALEGLFTQVGVQLTATTTTVGPGLARLAQARRPLPAHSDTSPPA